MLGNNPVMPYKCLHKVEIPYEKKNKTKKPCLVINKQMSLCVCVDLFVLIQLLIVYVYNQYKSLILKFVISHHIILSVFLHKNRY